MLIALVYRLNFVIFFVRQRKRRRFLEVVERPAVDIHFRRFILADSLRYHRSLVEYRRLIFCCYTLAERSYIRRLGVLLIDRKSTRLNSSHVAISYAAFCLKKKK